MQITIDTTTDTRAELLLVAELAQRLADLVPADVIKHEDRPDVGAPEPEPIAVRVTTPAIINQVPDAAAAFGGVPVPPAVPTVPSAAPAQTGAQVDADGLPWDARIHAGSRGTNKDGRWTAKRGLNDDAFVKRVQDELRAVQAIPVPVPVPPAMVTHEAATQGLPTAAGSVPLPPVPNVAPPIPTAPAATVSPSFPTDFPAMMAALAPHFVTKKVDEHTLRTVAQQIGLPEFVSLMQRPDLVPAYWLELTKATGI